MTTLPAAGYFTNAARTNGEAKQGLDDLRDVAAELLGGTAETTLTIAAGAVTATGGEHAIDTEAAAATDDLTHIDQTNMPDGRLLLIRAVNAAHVVTVKHASAGAGQILLTDSADFVLDKADKWLLLIRRGTDWVELLRSFGSDQIRFSAAINTTKAAAVASAAATNIWAADGNLIHVTGVATITSFGTAPQAGARRTVVFDGVLTLTNGANLILQGGANVTTAAGDVAEVVAETTTQHRVVFSRANGASVTGDLPRSYLSGLGLANNGADASHDIDIAAGACRDQADSENITFAAAITKRIDASWTVGSGNGGLDGSESVAGTPDANTWYHVFAVRRTDTGVSDVIFGESFSAPILPASYTKKRYLGSVLTDGSANILGFVQIGDIFLWKDPPLDVDVTNQGDAAVARTLSVAPGAPRLALLNVFHTQIGGGSVYMRNPAVDDETSSSTAGPLGSHGNNGTAQIWGQVEVLTDAAAAIETRSNSASHTVRIATVSYVNERGRND